MQRVVPVAVVSLAVGLAAGWCAATWTGEAEPGDPAVEVTRTPASATPVAVPELEGRPAPPAPSPSRVLPVPVGPIGSPDPWIPGEFEIDSWSEWTPPIVEGREVQGWRALLTLYALAGRPADFQKGVGDALEAGLDAGSILELVKLLPAVADQVATLDALRAAHPDAGWEPLIMADIYFAGGAEEQAAVLLEQALEDGIQSDVATRLIHASPDRAASVLAELASRSPFTTDLEVAIAQAFLSVGRPELGLPFIESALADGVANMDALRVLAQIDPGRATARAEALTREDPDNAEVWAYLAEVHSAAGDDNAAFAAYRAAAERSLSADYLYGMMRTNPEAAMEAAMALSGDVTDDELLGSVAKVAMRANGVEAAMETLLRAHEIDPSDNEWMVAMVALDPARAARVLEASVREYGGDSSDEVIGALGNALRELGQSTAAFDRYLEAHQMDPTDWEWQRGLARSDPGRALDVLVPRLSEEGESGDLLGAIGDAYAGLGQDQEARTYYERAIQSGGGTEWMARMVQVDREYALERLRSEVTNSPSADAWKSLGDAYLMIGDTNLANRSYAHARELDDTTLIYEIRYRQTGGG